jgi:hypothetical protein
MRCLIPLMGIDSNPGRDHEITRLWIASQIRASHAAECDAAWRVVQRRFRCRHDFKGNIQVVRQCVGCSKRQHCQRRGRVGHDLGDVMDRPIAAAGKNRVAARLQRKPCLVPGVIFGLRGYEFRFNAAVSEHRQRRFQFPLAPLAAAGIRVVEQGRLAHSVVEAGLSNLECRSWIVPEQDDAA